jgi:hypothetical protein
MKIRFTTDVVFWKPKDPQMAPTIYLVGPRQGTDGRAHLEVISDFEGATVVTYDLIAQPPGQLALVGLHVGTGPVRLGAAEEVHERTSVPLKEPSGAPAPLTAETLRRVRIGDYVRFLEPVLEHLRNPAGWSAARIAARIARFRAAGFGFLVDGTEKPRMPARRGSHAGRPRLSNQVLARAVSAYLGALERDSARPVLDAATRLGERPERLRDLLHRARLRGLLAGSKSGTAGGALTALGRAALRQTKRRNPR